MAQPSACATQVVGSQIPDVSTFGAQTYAFTTCQIALGVIPSPQILSRRLILRKIVPQVMAAAQPTLDSAEVPEKSQSVQFEGQDERAGGCYPVENVWMIRSIS